MNVLLIILKVGLIINRNIIYSLATRSEVLNENRNITMLDYFMDQRLLKEF